MSKILLNRCACWEYNGQINKAQEVTMAVTLNPYLHFNGNI